MAKKSSATNSDLLKLENEFNKPDCPFKIQPSKPVIKTPERPEIAERVGSFLKQPQVMDGDKEVTTTSQCKDVGDDNNQSAVEMGIVIFNEDVNFFVQDCDLQNNFFNQEARKESTKKWPQHKAKVIEIMSKTSRHFKRNPRNGGSIQKTAKYTHKSKKALFKNKKPKSNQSNNKK